MIRLSGEKMRERLNKIMVSGNDKGLVNEKNRERLKTGRIIKKQPWVGF